MQHSFQPNNFDLLRLFAASQVVLVHSTKELHLTKTAFYDFFSIFHGVPIFFTLSGFLISAAWERNPNLLTYTKNRMLRIFPGLWACIAITVLFASLLGFSFMNSGGIVWAALQSIGLIYTPTFLNDFGFGSYNGSLWTIPVELQFYVALPILYFLSSKMGTTIKWALAGLVIFSIATYIYLHFRPDVNGPEPINIKLIRYSFIPHIYLFFLGVILQKMNAHVSIFIRGKGLYWLVAFCVFSWTVPETNLSYMIGLLMLGVTAVSLAYTLPELSGKILGRTDISYGVYIYHGLMINILVETGNTGHWVFGLVVFGLTYLLGYLSWVFVEQPCIRRKTKTNRVKI